MSDTPASGERVQKYVFNFEIYRFAKKSGQITPSSPKSTYNIDGQIQKTESNRGHVVPVRFTFCQLRQFLYRKKTPYLKSLKKNHRKP